jgi:O-methyltransferase
MLYRLVREIERKQIEGDIVECGVYKGGSAAVMAYAAKSSSIVRGIWLFDSFEGLPPPTKKDGERAFGQYYKGLCTGTVREVREIFGTLKIKDKRVHIVPGWFKDTFPIVKVKKIALLHIDADWYESVGLCLDKFYANVARGGFVVLDDYGCWEGCRRATDEFIRKNKLKIKLIRVTSVSYYFQKP